MKIAVVAVTKQGIEKGEEVKSLLENSGHNVMLYVPGKYSLLKLPGTRVPFRIPLRDVMVELMGRYEAVVCIMALGIVVRLIAPVIRDKKSDPAVVVMDEMGQNIVSVLSGHWGGANELTREIAAGLCANPVVTTATDVRGLPAVEMIAKEKGWEVQPFTAVRKVNAAIVNSDPVYFYCNDLTDINLPQNVVTLSVDKFNPRKHLEQVQVVVTNRSSQEEQSDVLYMRPKNLVLGIGCRKGIDKEMIRKAVFQALGQAEVVLESVREIASINIKSEEEGLIQLAEEFKIPLRFFTAEEICAVFEQDRDNHLNRSETVRERIGVDGVCEPAALLAVGKQGKLILPRIALDGVTVAIAEDI